MAVLDALAFKEPKTKYMTEVLRAFTGCIAGGKQRENTYRCRGYG